MTDPNFRDDELYDELDAPQPFWTLRRIVLTVIVILMLIALLVYSLPGIFYPPPPPPTPVPGPLI